MTSSKLGGVTCGKRSRVVGGLYAIGDAIVAPGLARRRRCGAIERRIEAALDQLRRVQERDGDRVGAALQGREGRVCQHRCVVPVLDALFDARDVGLDRISGTCLAVRERARTRTHLTISIAARHVQETGLAIGALYDAAQQMVEVRA